MGAKTWMIAYVDEDAVRAFEARPIIDRDASTTLVHRLFPKEKLEAIDDGMLSYTSPPDDEIYVGCFSGVSVVAAKEFGIDFPSQLALRFLEPGLEKRVYLHAMHSVVDWFAFAIWERGKLVRSLSLSPDSGIIEDIGPRRPFELRYWEGQHPAVDPADDDSGYPFPFHPLELGEVALRELFGYQIEGFVDDCPVAADEIPLLSFKRKKTSAWKFW